MAQLFTHYSLSEIILFILALSVAAKKFVEFIDWIRSRARQAIKQADKPSEVQRVAKKNQVELQEIKKEINELKESINLLIASDRDDIKASITKDHHYFCYQLGYIDDYSLDCMEKRYSHYKEQGGNSFIHLLMEEVRALPKKINQPQVSNIQE